MNNEKTKSITGDIKNKEQKLFDLIQSKMKSLYGNSEILFGKIHLIDISEEEYIDHFTNVEYRCYHSDGYCFDCVKKYSSEAEDGGGGIIYEFFDDNFDGFKRIDIDLAIQIISDFNPETDNYFRKNN